MIVSTVAFLMSEVAEGINGCTIPATEEQVGLISDPAIERVAYMNVGWTTEELANRFSDTFGADYELDRTKSIE